MDDSFQFIIESPQHATGHKKRPRLVTSCDNCRLKKIKCLQPSPESKCEACKTAKIPCRFRDRERYFAERSRAIAGPSATSNYSNGQRSDGSMDAFAASGIVAPEDNSRYQPYSTDVRRSVDYSRTATASPVGYNSNRHSMGYNSMSPSPAPMMQHTRSPSQSRQIQLFNPDFPQFPNHTYMETFMPLFFQHYSNEFPFIIYDDVIADYVERRSAPIMNTIAALAVGHCSIPELTGRNLPGVISAYGENARGQLNTVGHVTTEENLRAFMLFAWFEYKQQRMSGFRDYSHLALRMCAQLGYTAPNGALLNLQDTERRRQTSKGLFTLNYNLSQLR
ncbi:c6 transcription [Moniliophthora roreri MCA 2997]|uniref:C6 transcription n=1 Tax=Moniliophthora roreri (strain MCA 2997) TaxID=1381753 RepID=V2XBA4_MONRO|nr:c6 transcription [Moniliophthora roreri MCA 2997]KAI3597002.1 c6 transcription [Moniliophthora roreri]